MTSRKGERTFAAQPVMLPDQIGLNAKWHGDKPALICGDVSRTWAQLDAATNRVANALLDMGLEPGQRVGLVMSNSLEMVEIMLGIGKAGLVIAPINLTVPDQAVLDMLADASARAVFVSANQCARLADRMPDDLAGRAIAVGAAPAGWRCYDDLVATASDQPSGVVIAPDDWMHVMYSSGTTGLPKGIVHTHGNRLDWTHYLAVSYRYHSDARVLISVGLFSNFSWALLQTAVMLGATVVVMETFTPKGFLEITQTHRITHTAMVPVQYQLILAEPGQENYDLSSLESLICGGAALHQSLQETMRKRFACGFFEMYGATEGVMTVITSEEKKRFPDSVGKPFQGSDIRIVDSAGAEVATGESGEVVAFTPFMMEGYLNRPDANAETVWKGPDGRNWLRTGDVGKVDDHGMLSILDRIKDMIVSGAQNIFPADIESVINGHEAVFFATVIGVAHPKWGETPLAVVQPHEGAVADEVAIMEWTNARVGKRQRIAGVVFTDDIPRNPNGKVLKRFLRDRYGDFMQKGADNGA